MRISMNASLRPAAQSVVVSRKTGLLAGVLLLAMDLVLLYVGFGFAEYGLSGFLWWSSANGTVISASNSSVPTVEFVDAYGTPWQFHEDYIVLCQSRRSFCWVRNFSPGQTVPIVYDPHDPNRAYIHDWALTANALTWVFEACLAVLLLWMLTFRFTGKPRSFSLEIGQSAETDQLTR
jgi:hypothetical protein